MPPQFLLSGVHSTKRHSSRTGCAGPASDSPPLSLLSVSLLQMGLNSSATRNKALTYLFFRGRAYNVTTNLRPRKGLNVI